MTTTDKARTSSGREGGGEAEAYCVIIPGYREEAHIADVVRSTLEYCPNVIVVDDGSDDATAVHAEAAGAQVIRHETNKGKGIALATGFAAALEQGFKAAITLDADGQHDPAEIPAFIRAYERTGDPVLTGNRMADTKDMPLVRRWTNRFMSWLLSREMKQAVPDTQCGYRLYAREVIPHLRCEASGFAAESEQLLYLAERGIRIGAVPIKTIYGDEESKINPLGDTLRFFDMLRRYRKSKRSA